MCGFCDVWVCVCVGVLVVCVLEFTVFCVVCTVFLYCFVCVYLFLFVLSVMCMYPLDHTGPVTGLLYLYLYLFTATE